MYENVLDQPGSPVYDSSPHVWTYGVPCDITPDAPYSSYSAIGDAGISKLQFIGSVGVGGGQGNADCIYGSCDDHDTYGISGSGWQGPGNGEEPGDLWNPANGSAPDAAAGTSKLGYLGGAGIEGGQGNSDSIYGSHDDHSTYGVGGGGWQGPGNGEAPGDLWNPAVAETDGGMCPAKQLAMPVEVTTSRVSGGRTLTAISEDGVDGEGLRTVKSSPGHIMMMGHACIFGALSATKDVASNAMQGDFSVSWNSRFRDKSTEACEAVTPVGGYMLKTYILKD